MAQVTLKLQMGSFAVEVSGEADYAEKKLKELIQEYGPVGKVMIPSGSKIQPSASGSLKKDLAAGEFLKKLNPKSQPDRALALGYFLEKIRGMESFATSDLVAACREAKSPPFTNVSDSVGKLVGSGLLMGAGDNDGRRTYVLTASGEEQIDGILSSAL